MSTSVSEMTVVGAGHWGAQPSLAQRRGHVSKPMVRVFPTGLAGWVGAAAGLGEGKQSGAWMRGRTKLGKLSGTAVGACHMVWTAVTEIWVERQRGEWNNHSVHSSLDALEGCDADTPGVYDADLLGCPLLLRTDHISTCSG